MRINVRPRPHVVYRCYSHTGLLLYVGSTSNLRSRLRSHRGCDSNLGRSWFELLARVTVEEFPDGPSAVAAENAAIRDERPAFNLLGSGKRSPRVTGYTIEPHVPTCHAKAQAVAS